MKDGNDKEVSSHNEPTSPNATHENNGFNSSDTRALSPIDGSAHELVVAEEMLWKRLAALKARGDSHDTRLALRSTYADLAFHYAMLGGNEAAVLFLKNALSKGEDAELRHQLARLQAKVPGYDFIASFTTLLQGRSYDLKLTLECCYFLEQKGLHTAALGVLEAELTKRLMENPAPEPDTSTATTLHSFLRLLQANISVERQIHIQDYRDIFAVSFPDSIFNSTDSQDEVPEETIVGQTTEEFIPNHGLVDEAKHYFGLAFFAAQHYAIPILTIAGATMLVLLSIFRVHPSNIEFTGSSLLLLLGAFFTYELLRSFRLTASRRLREQSKISRNISIVSLAMLVLNWIGPKIFGRGEESFFPLVATKVVSAALVAAALWQTYLHMAAIRKSLKRVHQGVIASLERTTFRRRLASIVRTTAGWALLLSLSPALMLMSRASPKLAIYGGLQALFFLMTWRWGSLEARAEKQRLRDELALLIAMSFIGLVGLELVLNISAWSIVTSLSLDCGLLLLIAICYVLQITKIRPNVISLFAIPLLFLNFVPVLEQAGFLETTDQVLAGLIPGATLGVRVFVVLSIIAMVPLLRRRRRDAIQAQIIQGDVYMKSKYEFHGGQYGAVGDQASATNFTQVNQQTPDNLDLKTLALELAQLKNELISHAKTPEHFASIAEVVSAEQAADKGEREVALASLKKAGAWIWDVATKVGIGVATAAAKQHMGF